MKTIVLFDADNRFKINFYSQISEIKNEINFIELKKQDEILPAATKINFDVLILDFFSFDQNALATIKKIKNDFSEKIVIVISSYLNIVLLNQCLNAGADVCLDKNNEEDLSKLMFMIK